MDNKDSIPWPYDLAADVSNPRTIMRGVRRPKPARPSELARLATAVVRISNQRGRRKRAWRPVLTATAGAAAMGDRHWLIHAMSR